MAKHKARSRRATVLIGVLITAAAALLTSLVGSTSASAVTAPGKSVVLKDNVVLGRCNFTLQSVNPSIGTSSIRLAANAQPATLLGYATNAYTQVFCYVFGGQSGNLLTQFAPFRNGPVVPTESETPTIAFETSYTLCGFAFVKLNNGNQDSTAFVCA